MTKEDPKLTNEVEVMRTITNNMMDMNQETLCSIFVYAKAYQNL